MESTQLTLTDGGMILQIPNCSAYGRIFLMYSSGPSLNSSEVGLNTGASSGFRNVNSSWVSWLKATLNEMLVVVWMESAGPAGNESTVAAGALYGVDECIRCAFGGECGELIYTRRY